MTDRERESNRRADKTKLTVADISVFQIRLTNLRVNMGSCKYVYRYQLPEPLNCLVPQGITRNSSEDGGSVLIRSITCTKPVRRNIFRTQKY